MLICTSHISFTYTTHPHTSFSFTLHTYTHFAFALHTSTHFAFCTLSIFNIFVFDLICHWCCVCVCMCVVYVHIYFVLYFTLYTSISFHPCFLYFVFFLYSCVFGLLVLLLFRQISPWGLIKYISIYLSIFLETLW